MVTDQAMKNLDGEAIRRGRKVGIDPGIMRLAIEAQRRGRPFVVETEDVQGDVHFYRCQQEGSSRVLYLNVAHPFFSEVYMAAGSTGRSPSAGSAGLQASRRARTLCSTTCRRSWAAGWSRST